MKPNKRHILVILLVIFTMFQSINIFAANDILAVSLVIDTSGSMEFTDPQRLCETAANVFIDLLSPEDYLGIITFNSKVDMVIPIQQLKDDTIKNSYKEQLRTNLAAVGNTDYKAALDKANEELSKVYDPNARKVIIFLTDGEPDPDNIGKNPELMDNYMNDFWNNTISSMSKSNIAVYSIGFSDAIDVEVLERIASKTKGDVRIYKDAEDLDKNLIQMLKSREIITTHLLAPTYENNILIQPSISTDFWMKNEGYRNGEEAVVSASLYLGNIRLHGRSDLDIDKFALEINYQDGTITNIELFDDGNLIHGDIKGNDGIFSSVINLDKNGRGNASIKVSGMFKGEELSLEKPIGEFFVDDPGNILVSSSERQLWIMKKDNIVIPLKFENHSSFKEVVFIEASNGFETEKKQIEINPKEDIYVDIQVTHQGLNKGVNDLKIFFNPINELTFIDNEELDFSIEVVSFFENISRSFKEKSLIIVPILIIFAGIPLFIYLMGMLLYLIIVKPQTRVKGILTYWEEVEPKNKMEIDLRKKKKNKVIITFDSSKTADYHIDGSKFKYDIEISSEFTKKNKAFLAGWKVLFTRNANIVLVLRCTQPGIVIYEGDISTKLNLNKDMVFSSGEFGFSYVNAKSRWNKGPAEGKNILEGRV